MAPLADRLASARAIADGRRIVRHRDRARLGTRYTADTLAALRRLFPRVQFVWLMGADILAELPRWRRWIGVVHAVPFAVCPRPGYNQPRAGRPGGAAAAPRAGGRRGRRPCCPEVAAGLDLPAGAAECHIRNGLARGILRRGPTRSRSRPIARKPTTAEPGAAQPPRETPHAQAPATLHEAAKAPGTPRKKAAAAGPKPRAPREPRPSPRGWTSCRP